MKFKLSHLDKQLRVVGGLLQPITQVKSPKNFKKVQWLYKKLYAKKRPKSDDIFYREEWIKGNAGNRIRLCIYGLKIPRQQNLSPGYFGSMAVAMPMACQNKKQEQSKNLFIQAKQS